MFVNVSEKKRERGVGELNLLVELIERKKREEEAAAQPGEAAVRLRDFFCLPG